jgi:hypothetical protein
MRKFIPIIIFFLFLGIAKAQYIPGENASFIVQVSDIFGNPIDNAECYGYIFNPDFQLIFYNKLEYKNGFYTSNFTIPNKYGTYLEVAECKVNLYGSNKTIRSAKTFYVSSAFDVIERQLSEYISNVTINVTLNITGNLTEAVSQAQEDIIGLLLALHSTPETSATCYNSTHRLVTKTATWEINKKTYNITKQELEYCSWGCNNETGNCYASPQQSFYIGGIIILISIVVLIIWRLLS